MKKWTSLLLTLAMLFCLSACGGGDEGITVLNTLGTDLTWVNVEDLSGNSTAIVNGIADGKSDTATVVAEDGNGYIIITATDADKNMYNFRDVYVHEGVEVRLEKDEYGNIFARYDYDDETWEYMGELLSLAELNALLEAVWVHTENDNVMVLDGLGAFAWMKDGQEIYGTYESTGEKVTFYYDDVFTEATLTIDRTLVFEGESGCYYDQND